MVQTCHMPWQPLQNHPSRRLWGRMMPWSAEKMLDGQHQRLDTSAYARAAHKGLLQKRLEEDLCWIILHVPPTTQLVKGLNWTELIYLCQWTLHQTLPSFRDHFCLIFSVVSKEESHCTCIYSYSPHYSLALRSIPICLSVFQPDFRPCWWTRVGSVRWRLSVKWWWPSPLFSWWPTARLVLPSLEFPPWKPPSSLTCRHCLTGNLGKWVVVQGVCVCVCACVCVCVYVCICVHDCVYSCVS